MSFRRFQPADLKQCLELYELNRPGRFPDNLEIPYHRYLEQQTAYTLIAEYKGRIVASGSIQYLLHKNWPVLCFGLIHPDLHGNGIGTALVLGRLALLNTEHRMHHVHILAVSKSIGYYQRLGFRLSRPWKDKDGHEHPSGVLDFTRRDVRKCRKLLKAHEIFVPPDQALVPIDRPHSVWLDKTTKTWTA